VRLLSALIVLASVSSTSGAGAFAPASKDACDLITKAEMEAALGVPMRTPEPQIMGMCEYRSAGDHPHMSVRLMLNRAESRQEWEQHERGLDPDVKATALEGIGDAALLWNRTLDARAAILKGKTTLTIVLDVGKMMPKVAETQPVARRLAEIAVARMP